MNFFVFKDLEKASQALGQRICAAARKAMSEKSLFSLVLSGGSSPRRLYQLLAAAPYCDQLDWQKIHLFWGDERCVPPGHPDSNYHMTKEALLDKITIPAAHIHRMTGEIIPEEGAKRYQQEIAHFFAGQPPIFDFVLLGLGNDGHTASLFPQSAGLQEKKREVIAVPPPLEMTPHVSRLTLTLQVLNQAREICFLATGDDKKKIFQEIKGGQGQGYPAAMVVDPDWYLVD